MSSYQFDENNIGEGITKPSHVNISQTFENENGKYIFVLNKEGEYEKLYLNVDVQNLSNLVNKVSALELKNANYKSRIETLENQRKDKLEAIINEIDARPFINAPSKDVKFTLSDSKNFIERGTIETPSLFFNDTDNKLYAFYTETRGKDTLVDISKEIDGLSVNNIKFVFRAYMFSSRLRNIYLSSDNVNVYGLEFNRDGNNTITLIKDLSSILSSPNNVKITNIATDLLIAAIESSRLKITVINTSSGDINGDLNYVNVSEKLVKYNGLVNGEIYKHEDFLYFSINGSEIKIFTSNIIYTYRTFNARNYHIDDYKRLELRSVLTNKNTENVIDDSPEGAIYSFKRVSFPPISKVLGEYLIHEDNTFSRHAGGDIEKIDTEGIDLKEVEAIRQIETSGWGYKIIFLLKNGKFLFINTDTKIKINLNSYLNESDKIINASFERLNNKFKIQTAREIIEITPDDIMFKTPPSKTIELFTYRASSRYIKLAGFLRYSLMYDDETVYMHHQAIEDFEYINLSNGATKTIFDDEKVKIQLVNETYNNRVVAKVFNRKDKKLKKVKLEYNNNIFEL